MHQNRASPFASDFYRRRGYRREFRSEDHFYPFSSPKKSRFASGFFAEKTAHLGASKKSRDCWGAVKVAAAAAENRAILVHSAPHPSLLCLFFFWFCFGSFSGGVGPKPIRLICMRRQGRRTERTREEEDT